MPPTPLRFCSKIRPRIRTAKKRPQNAKITQSGSHLESKMHQNKPLEAQVPPESKIYASEA